MMKHEDIEIVCRSDKIFKRIECSNNIKVLFCADIDDFIGLIEECKDGEIKAMMDVMRGDYSSRILFIEILREYLPHISGSSDRGILGLANNMEVLCKRGKGRATNSSGGYDFIESVYVHKRHLYYAHAIARRMSDADLSDGGKATMKWLNRRAEKESLRSRGIKDTMSRDLFDAALSVDFCIPIGFKSSLDLMDPTRTWYLLEMSKDADNMIHWMIGAYFIIKIMEKSDTPTWFVPSEDLILMLINTTPSILDEGLIRLPAPAMFVEVPEGIFFENGEDVVAIGIVEDFEFERFYDIGSVKRVVYGGRELLFLFFYRDSKTGVLTFTSFDVLLSDIAKEGVFEKDDDSVLRFLINFLIYLTSPNVTPRSRTVSKDILVKSNGKRKPHRLTLRQELIIGTDVRLTPEARDIMRKRRGGSKISYSFMVRGHWRNQACGPGMSMHRMKWIEPYIKGKDIATRVLSHQYVADDVQEQ